MTGERRFKSGEHLLIAEDVLARISDSNAPPPLERDLMIEAQNGPPHSLPVLEECTLCHGLSESADDATLEECPRCGAGMVLPGVALEWRITHPNRVEEGVEIDLTTDPEEETP